MLCLIVTSPLYSQKSSNDTCCVPCISLKKALIVREERLYCETQLGFARDSILTLQKIIFTKDTILLHRDSAISIFESNREGYKEIINNKDSIITTYGKEIENLKTSRNGAYVAVIVTVILSILLGL